MVNKNHTSGWNYQMSYKVVIKWYELVHAKRHMLSLYFKNGII